MSILSWRTAGASAMMMVAVTCVNVSGAIAATVLQREPGKGRLRYGEKVLVDDGSCPAGQIKEIVGGKNNGQADPQRIRNCVKRR